jgi:hypothetical protein
VRQGYALLCAISVVVLITALIAGASFALDVAYVCGALGVGAALVQWRERQRRGKP